MKGTRHVAMQVGCPESGIEDAVQKLTAAGLKVHSTIPSNKFACVCASGLYLLDTVCPTSTGLLFNSS